MEIILHLIFFIFFLSPAFAEETPITLSNDFNYTVFCEDIDPNTPIVNCSLLPDDFLICEDPENLHGNTTVKNELGYGCAIWGGQRYEDVERTRIWCNVIEDVECCGDRRFLSLKEFPCINYNGHYFVTTLIYSVSLGFLAVDRFCLGHKGTAVGKLLTLGGVGIWWIVDIVLLICGNLKPADDSNWVPYY